MDSPLLPITGSTRYRVDDFERYRTFWPRRWAGVVDGFVFLPISLLDKYFSSPARSSEILISWAIFSTLAPLPYSILMHARYGQTLGKMTAHVKVGDISESRLPSLKQAFLRDIGTVATSTAWLIYFVHLVLMNQYAHGAEQAPNLLDVIIGFSTLGWFLLELITMLTNRKRRALHDFIASSVVTID